MRVVKRDCKRRAEACTAFNCNWENSFGDLLLKSYSTERRVVKVEISQTDQFLSTHEVCLYSYIARAILPYITVFCVDLVAKGLPLDNLII